MWSSFQNYLQKTTYPHLPVTVVRDGQESAAFRAAVPGAA